MAYPLSLRGLAVPLLALTPGLLHAATLNVPSASYPTIQSGVDAARSGDTVLVADGTYSGSGNRDIDFHGKSLTVTSQNGPTKTIVDCGGFKSKDGSGNHRGFHVHSGEPKAIISGFTIKNGYEMASGNVLAAAHNPGDVKGDEAVYVGGGVAFVDNSRSVLLLAHCIVYRNTADGGGGVYCESSGGTITLTDCTVFDNTADEGGGGISNAIGKSGKITEINCMVFGNTADLGGGIVNADDTDSSGKIKLVNCTITKNAAEQDGEANGCGSAIFNFSDRRNTVLTNCIIFGNKGDEVMNGDSTTDMDASYSDIQDGCPGTGNINAKPSFINAAIGNFHLKPDSPCLGKGTSHSAPSADRNSKTRPNPPSMGAYE